ncbi:MAG: hypothetical protein Q7S19_03095 [bacterium]|nr:hypothetical protein [bacterium]
MKLSEFKKRDITFYPVLFLERFYPEQARHSVLSLSQYLFYLFLIGLYMLQYGNNFPYLINLLGLAIIFLTFGVATLMLEAFFLSYYYSGLTAEELDAGRIIYQVKNGDLVSAMLSLPIGQKLQKKLGLRSLVTDNLLTHRQMAVEYEKFELPNLGTDRFFTTTELVLGMYRQDQGFARLLSDNGIGEHDLMTAINSIIKESEELAAKERWWSRENLQGYVH